MNNAALRTHRPVLLRNARSFQTKLKPQTPQETIVAPDPTKIQSDMIGPPHQVSNLRPIVFKYSKNESRIEKQYRLKRQEVHNWNHQFWENHNRRFFSERDAFIKKNLPPAKQTLTADEMSVFYKSFLDRNWKSHVDYNIAWYKKNFNLLRLAISESVQDLPNNMYIAFRWLISLCMCLWAALCYTDRVSNKKWQSFKSVYYPLCLDTTQNDNQSEFNDLFDNDYIKSRKKYPFERYSTLIATSFASGYVILFIIHINRKFNLTKLLKGTYFDNGNNALKTHDANTNTSHYSVPFMETSVDCNHTISNQLREIEKVVSNFIEDDKRCLCGSNAQENTEFIRIMAEIERQNQDSKVDCYKNRAMEKENQVLRQYALSLKYQKETIEEKVIHMLKHIFLSNDFRLKSNCKNIFLAHTSAVIHSIPKVRKVPIIIEKHTVHNRSSSYIQHLPYYHVKDNIRRNIHLREKNFRTGFYNYYTGTQN